MANIGETIKSILAGNLNSGLSYLIKTVINDQSCKYFSLDTHPVIQILKELIRFIYTQMKVSIINFNFGLKCFTNCMKHIIYSGIFNFVVYQFLNKVRWKNYSVISKTRERYPFPKGFVLWNKNVPFWLVSLHKSKAGRYVYVPVISKTLEHIETFNTNCKVVS